MTLPYLLGDHLGSTSLTVDASMGDMAETCYHEASRRDNARFYDPQVGRFISADTVVPGGVQGLDRYAYTANNPVNRIDPTGHVDQSRCNYLKNYNCEMPEKAKVTDPKQRVTLEISDQFWEIWELRGPAEAIRWLANVFGIKLPTGVSWGYIPHNIGDRGVTPTANGALTDSNGSKILTSDGDPIYLSDEKVYISQDAASVKYGNDIEVLGVILGTMVHEARHAHVETAIEKELKRDLTPKDYGQYPGVLNAIETDADLAFFNNEDIGFSRGALAVREDHLSNFNPCGPNAGHGNTNCFFNGGGVYFSATGFIEWYFLEYFKISIQLPNY